MSYIFSAIELVAALIGTWCFHKMTVPIHRYFLFFLWYTFLVEISNALLKDFFNVDISWIYEIYTVTSFLFYFYWYYFILKQKIFRQIIIICALLFIMVTIIVELFPEQMAGRGFAFVTGTAGLLTVIFLHFYTLLTGDGIQIVKYKLSFWVSTALLLFYIGIIPLMLLSSYLSIEQLGYFIILMALNIILYGCYVIGFIWMKKEYNRF